MNAMMSLNMNWKGGIKKVEEWGHYLNYSWKNVITRY